MHRILIVGLGCLSLASAAENRSSYQTEGLNMTWALESGYRWDILRHHGPGGLEYDSTAYPGNVDNRLTTSFVENAVKGRLFFLNWGYIRSEGAFGYAVNATHVHQSQPWSSGDENRSFYMPLSAYTFDTRTAAGLELYWTPRAVSTIEGGWGHHRLWQNDWIDTRFAGPYIEIGSRFYLGEIWTIEWNASYSFLGRSKERLTPVLIDYNTTLSVNHIANTVIKGHAHGAGTNLRINCAVSDNLGVRFTYTYRDARTQRAAISAWDDTNITGSWNEITQLRTNALHLGLDLSF